jgi:hypothetical protein
MIFKQEPKTSTVERTKKCGEKHISLRTKYSQ